MRACRPALTLGLALRCATASRLEAASPFSQQFLWPGVADDLAAASGWLPHTTRAAITRLHQRGSDVRLATTDPRDVCRRD